MNSNEFDIRNAKPEEFEGIGKLMVKAYSLLEGFPKGSENPEYFKMLLNVGKLTEKDNTELLVAVSDKNKVLGAVVYFSDMKNYGTGGIASEIKNASGFRLLAVDPAERGKGIAKFLCKACITKAKENGHQQLFIHSTKTMKIAWKMYERLGFSRYEAIDFIKGELYIFGFKLNI